MNVLEVLAVVVPSLYMGWTIGADDAGAAMGSAVGAGIRTMRQAVTLIAVFTTMGAVLEGHKVVKTLGKGVVQAHLDPIAAGATVLVAAAWCHLAVMLGVPISTTQATVGSIAGVGCALGLPVNWSKFGQIAAGWVLSPILAMIPAYFVSRRLRAVLERGKWPLAKIEWKIGWLLTISGCYVAYTIGANNAANAVAPIVVAGLLDVRSAAIVGGIMIAVGALTAGSKVIETVGRRITRLDPVTAFSAELSAAIVTHGASELGIPISINETTAGAVIGVGLSRGELNTHTLKKIFTTWIASPVGSFVMSYALMRLYLSVRGAAMP
ncbi:inorganic phosphate transporter [Methanopyrus sp. SNP6]|uniref:inorganic phosphate transporter n=1 Tax=Methanopyrus sp. SNP6 TaxID=1937005 RepID=UPI0011E5E5A5|nr:inorganic phosphate transporter [Methanopyrus sp. SNP6]